MNAKVDEIADRIAEEMDRIGHSLTLDEWEGLLCNLRSQCQSRLDAVQDDRKRAKR